MHSLLQETDVWKKIELARANCDLALEHPRQFTVPAVSGRDVQVLRPEELPRKKGMGASEGQARLLHDLASIELQALEMCFRGLVEYPEAPARFREELHALTVSEAEHLKLCLEGIAELGHAWGDWPVHMGLWHSLGPDDSLIDRIVIVHRYLEGSGLDAGDTLLRRIFGMAETPLHSILTTIVREEIGHVAFGSRWYRALCASEGLDPENDFSVRMDRLQARIPKRSEQISHELRKAGGFTAVEISTMERIRDSMVKDRRQKPEPWAQQGKKYLQEILAKKS